MRKGNTPLTLLLVLTFLLISLPPITHASAATSCQSEIERDFVVNEYGPKFVLEVRFPNGGSRLYEDEGIPSSVSVPIGSEVELRVFGTTGSKGAYRLRAGVTAPPPSQQPGVSWSLSETASCPTEERGGRYIGKASIRADQDSEEFTAELSVSYTWTGEREGSTRGKTVEVTFETEEEETTTEEGGPVTMTFIGTSTTTKEEAEVTTTTTSGRRLRLAVSPDYQEVKGGETALFTLTIPFERVDRFEVSGLPPGAGHMITGGEGTYRLKIFTRLNNDGEFNISVLARSGPNVAEGSLRLKVVAKKYLVEELTSSPEGPSTICETSSRQVTQSVEERGETPSMETTATSSLEEKTRVVTVTTVIREGGDLLPLVTAAASSAIAMLLLYLILARKRG